MRLYSTAPDQGPLFDVIVSDAGIGKAIAQKLAKQGLNVVLVALEDETLDATYDELSTEYPNVEIRKVHARVHSHTRPNSTSSCSLDCCMQFKLLRETALITARHLCL